MIHKGYDIAVVLVRQTPAGPQHSGRNHAPKLGEETVL